MANAKQSKIEFEQGYAEWSGYSVEELHELGGHGEPCHCGEAGCNGWQMVFPESKPTTVSLFPLPLGVTLTVSAPADRDLGVIGGPVDVLPAGTSFTITNVGDRSTSTKNRPEVTGRG